ncbi:Zinc finger and BTB domain-containing protein 14 [Porphyridium purpureum]|uniref:Zinc finger and BTB domain-containing protein 14 n=1 Tax=Porphyridium purpureum TaxID=35688 RepID=A0A5J4Z1X0_PORPP|nr:Zinc finger and BTB domain-containing protein 14 [Porphyridium purpureum]|eukprot:POR7857..scf208_2
MATSTFGSVLRILLEEDELNEWLVQWLHPHVGVGAASGAPESGDATSAVTDFDVHDSFGERLAPQELACLPYLPLWEDIGSAVVWDSDLTHLNSSSCGVILPMCGEANRSRFVRAVMMTNASFMPLAKGVFLFPGHRMAAFRTRYGFAYISVGSCSDGSVHISLVRIWDNARMKVETFNTTCIEPNAKLLSFAVIERAGMCSRDCGEVICSCWRPDSSRRTEFELSAPFLWASFTPVLEESLRAVRLESPILRCRSVWGNGQLAFKVDIRSRIEVSRGASYPNMPQIRFLFFDRLTTASSVRHSRLIQCTSGSDSSTASKKRKRSAWTEVKSEDLDVSPLSSERDGLLCAMCEKSFRHRSDLKRHFRTIHQNEHKFVCDVCERPFKQKSHLQTHQRIIHEKRRDFECRTCGLSFSVVSNLNRHLRNMHPEAPDE